ncbi:MAG: transporter substrate-binding domain-containing protein [Thermomicrobiales bacterium]
MVNRRQFIGRTAAVAAALTATPRLAAMAQDATPQASPAASPVAGLFDISTLPLRNPGRLTIHADQPLYPPWFIDNDPTNGQGFEGALGAALAARMGFAPDEVDWGYTSFNASYAPGEKPFDFYMTEVSITEERKEAVDFSDPYYKSPLTVITREGSPVLEAKTLADLSQFSFATQVGTTYYQVIIDDIQPESDPLVMDTTADALQQLVNETVDATVADLESAQFITGIQFEGLVIAGVLPNNPGEGMGAVFEKGSELVPFFNEALASLMADGTHQAIVEEWLTQPSELLNYT